MTIRQAAAAGFFLCLLFCAGAAVRATEALDVAVGLKTLPLLKKRIAGSVNMAVVFDPAIAQSRDDAEAIKRFADDQGTVPGGERLVAMTVAINDLAKLKGTKLIFAANGLDDGGFQKVSDAAAAGGLLSLSTDLACVRRDKCVLGIATRPTVEIYFSRAAAAASHIEFSSSFIMLAKPN